MSSVSHGGVDVSGEAPAAPYLPVEGQIEVACDIKEFERRREHVQATLHAASQRAASAGVECQILNRDGGFPPSGWDWKRNAMIS